MEERREECAGVRAWFCPFCQLCLFSSSLLSTFTSFISFAMAQGRSDRISRRLFRFIDSSCFQPPLPTIENVYVYALHASSRVSFLFFFSLSLPSQSHKSYGKSSSFACVLDYTRARAPSSAAPEMMEIGPRGMMAIIRNRGIACTPRLPISPCPVIRV